MNTLYLGLRPIMCNLSENNGMCCGMLLLLAIGKLAESATINLFSLTSSIDTGRN